MKIRSLLFTAAVLFTTASCLTPATAVRAQDPTPPTPPEPPAQNAPLTRLGQIMNDKGVVLLRDSKVVVGGDTKEFRSLVKSGNFGVEAVSISRLGSSSAKTKGLIFYLSTNGSSTRIARSDSAMVDVEEAENLVKALRLIAAQGEAWKGKEAGLKRVTFRGQDDIRFGMENKGQTVRQDWYVAAGPSGYVEVDFTGADSFQILANLLEDGLKWLATQ